MKYSRLLPALTVVPVGVLVVGLWMSGSGDGALLVGVLATDGDFEEVETALGVEAQEGLGRGRRDARIRAESSDHHARVVLSTEAEIRGTVVDDEGIEVPGARVWAEYVPRQFLGDSPASKALLKSMERDAGGVMTDRSGRFRLRGFRPGLWLLSAERRDLFKVTADPVIELWSRDRKAGVTLRLSKGVSIQGCVVTSSGAPVIGAKIESPSGMRPFGSGRSGRQGTWDSPVLATTGLDGRFCLRGLTEGKHSLILRLPKERAPVATGLIHFPYARAPMMDRSQQQVDGIAAGTKGYKWVITLPRHGSIRAALNPRLAHHKPLLVELRSRGQNWTFFMEIESGLIVMKNVLVGRYEMTLRPEGYVDHRVILQVKEGEETNLGEITLTKEGREWRGYAR